jgi:uncharacterized repeat protein (TIGR03803 family)
VLVLKIAYKPFAVGLAIAVAGCSAQQSVPPYGAAIAQRAAQRPADTSGYTLLYNFKGGTDAALPTGLVQAGSTLYGASNIGGRHGKGSIFSLMPSASGATERVIYSFNPGIRSDGTYPVSPLTAMKAGGGSVLYGTTYKAGASGGGTIYSVTTGGAERTIYNFSQTEQTIGALLVDGKRLYGTTQSNGSDSGTVFSATATGAVKVIHTFSAFGQGGGNDPSGFLSEHNGSLFGTTTLGGAHSSGTMFEISSSGKLTQIYTVKSGMDGFDAESPLIVEGTGGAETIYGVTHSGGVTNQGTVFSLDPTTHKDRLIYQFTGYADGGNPHGNIVIIGGVLYGAATDGGAGSCAIGSVQNAGCGAIFSVDLATGQ